MQTPAPTPQPSDREDRYARKARILLDLFGPSGVERLKRAGLTAGLEQTPSTGPDRTEPLAGARGDLLERLRAHGLFDTDSPAAQPRPDPAQAADRGPAPRRATPTPIPLSARIVEHLEEESLEKEHPAVIAMVLKGQSRPVQMKVLRALPGATARATMRYLKG